MNFRSVVMIVIAALLLLCLADMPYGFYTLVRFSATASFAYLAYKYFNDKKEEMGFVFSSLALLFQPFYKFALGRTIWNWVDIIVACGLLFIVFQSNRNKLNS